MLSFFILFISFFIVSGEEITVHEEVYIDDELGENHFSDIKEAVVHVADKGKIYIGKNIFINDSNDNILIDKSIEFISLKPNLYEISFSQFNSSLFNLTNTDYIKLDGIKIKGQNNEIIGGNTSEINIKNSYFENCSAIWINYPSNYIDISIADSHFVDSTIKINTNGFSGNIDLSNNYFEANLLYISTIDLKDINIKANSNVFSDTSLKLSGNSSINADINNNIFNGNKGKIHITADGQNMHFNRNKILKNIDFEVYYTETSLIDFTMNWWNDIEGPRDNRVYGNIDYSNWALFDDFSRFNNDPYDIEDLRQAIENLGQAVGDRNFIYDMNDDGKIEFVDLVWITRRLK